MTSIRRSFALLTMLLVGFTFTPPVAGQTPELVGDLDSREIGARGLDLPARVGDDGERLVFYSGGGPANLFVTDGTAEGTRALADLHAGERDRLANQAELIDRIDPSGEPSGGRAIYGAANGYWVTDGTRAGTRWLDTYRLDYLGSVGPEALFARRDATDALGSGTEILALDLDTGARRSFAVDRWSFGQGVAWGDLLVLPASDNQFFEAVVVTDGTAAGTRVLVAETPEVALRDPRLFQPVGDRLVFLEGFDHEARLWATDGTAAGTGPLPATGDFELFGMVADPQGSGVAVVLSGELWVSDGTVAGTRRLIGDSLGGGAPAAVAMVDRFARPVWSDGRVYLAATDAVHGSEPWVADPATGTAHFLADLCPGACASEPWNFQAVDAGVFVSALEAPGEPRPWIVEPDGLATPLALTPTEEGVEGYFLVAEIASGYLVGPSTLGDDDALYHADIVGRTRLVSGQVDPRTAQRLGDRVLVSVRESPDGPGGILVTDGTLAGTGYLPGFGPLVPAHGSPEQLTPSGDRLFLLYERDPTRTHLAVVNGPGAPARPVAGPLAGVDVDLILGHGGADDGGVFVHGEDGRIWWTDGTAAGSQPLEAPQDVLPFAEGLWPVGGEVLMGDLGVPDGDLWLTDRASGRLVRLLETSVSAAAGVPAPSGVDELYFATPGGASGGSLVWVTDGTVDGTEALFETDHVVALAWFRGELHALVAQADELALRAFADPRAGGPGRTLATLAAPSDVTTALVAGDRLYFAFQLGRSGGLWVTDGTQAGTRPLIEAGVADAEVVGDRVAAVTDETFEGERLWWTDGTPGGTFRVEGEAAGLIPEIGDLAVAGGRLVFTASPRPGSTTGGELWTSDGTRAGARPVFDLAPGPGSSAPSGTTLHDGFLYFAADDGQGAGRELWRLAVAALDGSAPPRPDRPALTSSQVSGFRVWVDITPQGQSPIAGSAEAVCIPETLCVSGALAGRTEAFVRVIGPRPNGLLWPVITRFTPSRVEVWIEQVSTGDLRYYDLPATDPETSSMGELSGLFDRDGFVP